MGTCMVKVITYAQIILYIARNRISLPVLANIFLDERLVADEFVADRKNKLVSALILELEGRLHYYCFYYRLRRCMHVVSIKLTYHQ